MRGEVLEDEHKAFLKEATDEAAVSSPSGLPTVPSVLQTLKEVMPKKTTIMSEAISNYRKRETVEANGTGAKLMYHYSSCMEASANRHPWSHVHKRWLVTWMVSLRYRHLSSSWANFLTRRGLGAAIGAHLGYEATKTQNDLTVLVVGDGSFLFGVPASAFWIAKRYQTPFLTIVLNNGEQAWYAVQVMIALIDFLSF